MRSGGRMFSAGANSDTGLLSTGPGAALGAILGAGLLGMGWLGEG